MGWDYVDWIDLAQDRYQWRALVNTVMNFQVRYNARKFLSSCKIDGFSRSSQLHEWVVIWIYSTQPDFQLHWAALNNCVASVQFLCSPAHILPGWPLETQLTQRIFFLLFITPGHGLYRKHSCLLLHEFISAETCLTNRPIATDISLAAQFLLWANTPQYVVSSDRMICD
jgi:hypothetical protein